MSEADAVLDSGVRDLVSHTVQATKRFIQGLKHEQEPDQPRKGLDAAGRENSGGSIHLFKSLHQLPYLENGEGSYLVLTPPPEPCRLCSPHMG